MTSYISEVAVGAVKARLILLLLLHKQEKGPCVVPACAEDKGSANSSSDITAVLVACPETENESTVLNGLFVAEPVAHHGSSNRPSSRLEESKHEIHSNDEKVSKRHAEGKEIEPKRNVDKEETCSTPEQSNRQNSCGVESVTQLSRDDVPSGVGTHENGVYL